MNKKAFLTQFFTKKEVIDYTYATLFFLISTLFAFFAIRPSLSIAVSLRKEAEELRAVNEAYEKNITTIIKIQSQLEAVRSKVFLLDEAAPSKPAVKGVIDNLQTIVASEGAVLDEFNIPSIVLKDTTEKKDLKTIPLSFALNAEYTVINAIIKDLFLKRRITVIKNLEINKAEIGSSISADLKTDMDIENYYL